MISSSSSSSDEDYYVPAYKGTPQESFTKINQSTYGGASFENLLQQANPASIKSGDFFAANLDNAYARFKELSIDSLNDDGSLEESRQNLKIIAKKIVCQLNLVLLNCEVSPFEIKDPYHEEYTTGPDQYFKKLLTGVTMDLDRSVKKGLIKLFQKYLILDFSSLDSKENKKIFERLIGKRAISESRPGEENELVDQITKLWLYRDKIIESMKPDHKISTEIMRILYKKHSPEASRAKAGIDEAITSLYLKKIDEHLLSKMRQVLELIENQNEASAFFYGHFREKVANTIKHSSISNMLTELQRAVLGGYVMFKTAGKPVIPSFKEKGKETKEAEELRIKAWAKKVREWTGTNIFGEKYLVSQVIGAIFQNAALFVPKNTPIRPSDYSSVFEVHANVFESLMQQWEDPKKRKKIVAALDEALNSDNFIQEDLEKVQKQTSTEEVVNYLLELHRLSTQVILLSAMDVVLSCHSRIFSKIRKAKLTETIKNEKDVHIKDIVFDKVGNKLKATLTYKRNFTGYPSSYLIQQTVYTRSLPGHKEILDPISVHFFYTPPSYLDIEEMENFRSYISELEFLIKALKFPELTEELNY